MKSGDKMGNAISFVKVTVTFQRRLDGGLRAYSDEVPGFLLSGPNELVFSDVIPALSTLIEHNKKTSVRIEPLGDVRTALEEKGLLPSLPSLQSETREYVAALGYA